MVNRPLPHVTPTKFYYILYFKEGWILMGKKYKPDWAEAKKRCRLNQTDIRMAKELGMKPKSLTKNIPAENEQWKASVKDWIKELYENKFGKVL